MQFKIFPELSFICEPGNSADKKVVSDKPKFSYARIPNFLTSDFFNCNPTGAVPIKAVFISAPFDLLSVSLFLSANRNNKFAMLGTNQRVSTLYFFTTSQNLNAAVASNPSDNTTLAPATIGIRARLNNPPR